MPLESAACPRMAVWCPSMEPRRPGLPLESPPSWSWLITFLYLLLTTDLPGGRRRLGSWWGMSFPRDILGVVGKRHLARIIPTCLCRPAGSGRAPKAGLGASRRVGVFWDALAGPHPPLVSRSPLRDCRNGSRQERAPDHVTAITLQCTPGPAAGGSAGSGGPETSGGSRHAVDGPGPRPYTAECPAIQSSTFPRLITTVHKVPAGLWLSQVEHRTLNPAVGGSNPPRPAYLVVRAKTRWRGCFICNGFTVMRAYLATALTGQTISSLLVTEWHGLSLTLHQQSGVQHGKLNGLLEEYAGWRAPPLDRSQTPMDR